MLKFIIKRILVALPTLFSLILLTFLILKFVPGGPFDSEMAYPFEVKQQLEEQFKLNDSVLKQTSEYFKKIIKLDFGISFRFAGSRTVNEIIKDSFPVSFQLGMASLAITVIFGILFGSISAYYRGNYADKIIMSFALSVISIPNYLTASILIIIFGVWLKLLPIALWENWTSIILPSIALSLRPMALIIRLTRVSLIDVLSKDYIRTAKAKGLSFNGIIFKHALKNALLPVVTVLGPISTTLIAGSFVIEMIFAIPGMGRHYVGAVIDRDYTLIMGLTLVYGSLVIVTNILIDITYSWLDSRIRISEI